MSRDKTASPSSPILLVGEGLARFHNFAMACWAPEVHRDEDLHDVRSALAQLRSWEEDDPSERQNPPHIVAAISLAIFLRENVGFVLDEVPDVAPLWKPEFDAIEQTLCELAHKYKSGAEDYKASLESACSLAYQAKRMCKRLEAREQQRNTARRASPALAIKQFGKALIMDPYRNFKLKAIAEWDLKSDNDAKTKWTIDYNLLNDPAKERQIEEHADLLRGKQITK